MSVKKIVLAGYGNIARRHLRIMRMLLPEARVMVLREGAAPLDAEDRWAAVTRSLEEALEFAPDAALIASPASCHVAQAQAFACAGAHLLVEKPLSISMDGVDALIGECSARGRVLMVGYNLAFCEALPLIRKTLEEGCIGGLVSVRAEVGQYLPDWRPGKDYRLTVSANARLGGGVLFELSHEVDYVNWLLGGTRSVFCMERRSGLLEMDAADSAEILLQGVSGAAASIHLNMLQELPSRSCRLVGTEGIISWDCLQHTLSLMRCGDETERLIPLPLSGRGELYVRQMEHFLECIRGGNTPVVDGRRGKRTLEVVLAAERSSREGRVVFL